MIVDDGYCDVAAMPDSERSCWPEDCPEHIPTLPTPAVVTTEAVTVEDSTAYWRTGPWGPVMVALYLFTSNVSNFIRPVCNASG